MIDVIYVFKKAKSNLSLAVRNEFPKFFYGFFEVKKLLNISFIDSFEEIKKLSYISRHLFYLKSKFSKGFTYFSKDAINKMNKAKLIYATTDGIALSLANLKKRKILKTKLVANLMGIFDNSTYLSKVEYLDYIDNIIVFTFPLATKLKKLGYLNVNFIPLGVDVDFYNLKVCRTLNTKNNPIVLGLGVDRKRDWNKFRQIAKKMNDIEFRVITHESLKKEFSNFKNIKFLGNVSYLRTRQEMCTSDVLFLPTYENFYFSAQTTLFNALALKKAVIMPYDRNFNKYKLEKTLFYDRNCSLEHIINLIERAIEKEKSIVKSIEYNHNLVVQEYNYIKFAKTLSNFFIKLKEN